MPKMLIYLDTSVASAYFDDRDMSRMLATRAFWTRMDSNEASISDLVIQEVRRTSDPLVRATIEGTLRPLTVLIVDDEAARLAEQYLRSGVFGPSSGIDALHVATATVTRMDFVVSWNFRHMVKIQTVQRVNSVNLAQGYRTVDIRSPLEM